MQPPTEPNTAAIVRREVLRFAIPGAIGILVLALISLTASVAVARDRSMREATMTAEFIAGSVVQPRLTRALLEGRVTQIEGVDEALAATSEGADVVGLRLWDRDGVVVYANDPRVIGEQFPLGDRLAEFVGGAAPSAGVADISRPENRYLDPAAEIVDVRIPVQGQDGSTYLLQVHQAQDQIQDESRAIWWSFAPVLVGSLLLLGLLLGMLAFRMARRISVDLQLRQDLLQHAVSASDVERRRIAASLHDGTVQDLAGLSYTLAGLSARAAGSGDPESSTQLADAAARTRAAVRGLRSLLVDIYPPNLADTGLGPALTDLADALPESMTCQLDSAAIQAATGDVDEIRLSVLYRIAREAMANAARHAAAHTVSITILRRPATVQLTVVDDGVGFLPDTVGERRLGLRISADLARSVAGTFRVLSAPGAGTTVRCTVPMEEA